MASLQTKRLEIFTRENFQGNKHTYTKATASFPRELDLSTPNVSVKVVGTGSWRIYGCKNFNGKSFQLNEGLYPQLATENIKGISNIQSVAPVNNDGLDIEIPAGDVYADQWAALGAWYFGPKGENVDFFVDAAENAFRMNSQFRKEYFPCDPLLITEEIKQNEACKREKHQLVKELQKVCERLQNSIHWGSCRYQAHQIPEPSMASFLGYIAGILYNQNNVSNSVGPVTTMMEIEVGQEMCKMMGYGGDNTPTPWGHITAGGTVANLESMWASRNCKFYPLAIKEGLSNDKRVRKAKDYEVYVPALGRKKKVINCTQWELLNLDIDQVCAMSDEILACADIDEATFMSVFDEISLAALGFPEFMSKYNITQIPVVLCPKSKHYSWPKAAGLLGIGQHNLIGVSYDGHGRMCMDRLKQKLQHYLDAKTPVISVVAVIGATETSAVDNLVEMVRLRNEFRKEGLTFAINADGAWGGYVCSMLHDPDPTRMKGCSSSPLPASPLSPYTKTQLHALKFADTITVDPHKTGLAPYPAGALCYRNTTMKDFLTMEATYVMHGSDDPSVGSFGVLGSSAGSAAVGVYLNHKVLGLDRNGVGRVLGQCTYGAKLLYCVWLTLGTEEDNFTCEPMKPLPDNWNYTLDEAKDFIRKNILWKTNEEITQNSEAMKFLGDIGPDMFIIAFAVNIKGNKNITICNDINFNMFIRSSTTSEIYDVKRIKMFLTESTFPLHIYGDAVKQFRRRLGLPEDDPEMQKFLMNTNANPWTAENFGAFEIGKILRATAQNAIGQITDTPDNHYFVGVGIISDKGEVFADYLPVFDVAQNQYHAVTKLQFLQQDAVATIKTKQIFERNNPSNTTVVFGSDDKETLGSLLHDALKNEKRFSVWVGLPSVTNPPILKNLQVKVVDTPLERHFDQTIKTYPEEMKYFLFGDENGAYISHNMYKAPSFHQVVTLDRAPANVTLELLQLGIDISIQDMSGALVTDANGSIVDPLTNTVYGIECPSYNGQTLATTMCLSKPWAKTYFDSTRLNTALMQCTNY